MMHHNKKDVFKILFKRKKKILLSLSNPQLAYIRAVYSIYLIRLLSC